MDSEGIGDAAMDISGVSKNLKSNDEYDQEVTQRAKVATFPVSPEGVEIFNVKEYKKGDGDDDGASPQLVGDEEHR